MMYYSHGLVLPTGGNKANRGLIFPYLEPTYKGRVRSVNIWVKATSSQALALLWKEAPRKDAGRQPHITPILPPADLAFRQTQA